MSLYPLIKQPELWQSAHRPIVYEFDFQARVLSTVTDVGGFARFDLTVAYSTGILAGGQLFVVDGIYKGYHTVVSGSGTQYLTSTPFIGASTGNTIKRAVTVPIRVFSGYATGEDATLEPLYPITQVAEFVPEPTPQGTLRFDISAYVSAMFSTDIEPPLIGIDHKLFRRYRITLGLALTTAYRQAANAAIDDLSSYVNTGRPLSPEKKPQYQNCGKNLISQIVLENIITSYGSL
jgi:hypothetical protein